jgi:hypothetical protein
MSDFLPNLCARRVLPKSSQVGGQATASRAAPADTAASFSIISHGKHTRSPVHVAGTTGRGHIGIPNSTLWFECCGGNLRCRCAGHSPNKAGRTLESSVCKIQKRRLLQFTTHSIAGAMPAHRQCVSRAGNAHTTKSETRAQQQVVGGTYCPYYHARAAATSRWKSTGLST